MTEHKQDVEQIISACAANGLKINFAGAFGAWSAYSESMSAGWLSLPDDNEMLFEIVRNFLWKDFDSWKSLLDRYKCLIGSQYKDPKNKTWIFVGLLHGEDDYYFVLNLVGSDICRLASCVGSIEMADFRLHQAKTRDDDG